MSTIDSQKRMTNLLLAGNLAVNYKSTKTLGEIRDLETKRLQTDQKRNTELEKRNTELRKQSVLQNQKLMELRRKNSIKEQEIAERQQEIYEIKKIKFMRELFFHLTEKLTEVKNKKKPNLEKYFILASIKTELIKNKISSEMTDNFQEKKIIKDFISELENYGDIIWNKLNKVEKEDFSTILDILEVNEDEKIKKIENSENYKNGIMLDKEIETIEQCKDLHFLVQSYKKEISELK